MAKNVAEVLAVAVANIAKKEVDNAPYDKTYSGIISGVLFDPTTDIKDENFGKYKIRYGTGTEKTIKLNDGLVHEVGERVKVHVPENDRNRMYIEPIIKRVVPSKIVYDNEKNSYTEYRKVETNGKTYELESEYKLIIENKGNDQEVKKMILPNGSVIEFEGWDI